MIYKAESKQLGKYYWVKCFHPLNPGFQEWVVPARILGISPAELVRLLVKEYNAHLDYGRGDGKYFTEILLVRFLELKDAERWIDFINAKAQETQTLVLR